MADNRKLAQGLMMMTPAMRADLAQREEDVQRGKTVELLRRAGKEMYDNPIVNTAIGFTPVLGDVQAAGETMAALNRGAPWQETAGYAAGMLPFVPMIGKTVWHGSPHTFDKFDLSKIGTGEGAQAYGHGLYLAESPETAKSYQNALKLNNNLEITTNGEYLAKTALEMSGGDKQKAVELLKSGAIENTKMPEFAAVDSIETMHSKMASPEGALYKVDLPDEQIAKMLDWDKPLVGQPQTVREFAWSNQGPLKRYAEAQGEKGIFGLTGNDLYTQLLGDMDAQQISKAMNEAGIPGIQYLDQASRGAGEGTRNYVVFSDEIPQILERNGQPIAQALREYKQQFPEGMLGKTGIFETGTPASFEYIRNTEKSPYMGERFGQDIEPAGRYLSYKEPSVNMESMPNTWETGQVSFNNPLVVNFGEGYGTPTNWKKMVSESFGGKTGKDLSKAVANAGYDGIVTVDKYGTSEIVDLSNFIGKQK